MKEYLELSLVIERSVISLDQRVVCGTGSTYIRSHIKVISFSQLRVIPWMLAIFQDVFQFSSQLL
jgi:hypothetical protein